jgi:hypothetical protein
LSAVFFTLAFGVLMVRGLAANRGNLRELLSWPGRWESWPMLRWWAALIGLGIISAAATFFYGLPVQAFIRLLGYAAIFMTLFIAAYSLSMYGIKWIARWTIIGYLPILIYALVEAAACLRQPLATQIIIQVRSALIVQYFWGGSMALLATEPSFVAFQLVLLVFLLSFGIENWLKWAGWILVTLCLIFTKSGTVVGLAIIYLGLWGLFLLKRHVLARLTLVIIGVTGMILLASWLSPGVHQIFERAVNALFTVGRLKLMSISANIRFYYILNLVYAILETRGLGLGIGQYGYFWKDIYQRHIDYHRFDPTGEVARALASTEGYMKPWSVILGVGVDLGLLGLGLLAGFFWQVYSALVTPRHRALFFACLAALAGAYPIVTPHVWLALALMAGIGLESKREAAAE